MHNDLWQQTRRKGGERSLTGQWHWPLQWLCIALQRNHWCWTWTANQRKGLSKPTNQRAECCVSLDTDTDTALPCQLALTVTGIQQAVTERQTSMRREIWWVKISEEKWQYLIDQPFLLRCLILIGNETDVMAQTNLMIKVTMEIVYTF